MAQVPPFLQLYMYKLCFNASVKWIPQAQVVKPAQHPGHKTRISWAINRLLGNKQSVDLYVYMFRLQDWCHSYTFRL